MKKEVYTEKEYNELLVSKRPIKGFVDNFGEKLADDLEGVVFQSADLKGFKRAKEKAKVYNEYPSQTRDIIRSSFICDTYEQMIEVSEVLEDIFEIRVKKDTITNTDEVIIKADLEFRKPKLLRNIHISVYVESDIVEFQINLACIDRVKKIDDKLYKRRRVLEFKDRETYRPRTKEEAEEIAKLKAQSIEMYSKVINEYNATTTGAKIRGYKSHKRKSIECQNKIKNLIPVV